MFEDEEILEETTPEEETTEENTDPETTPEDQSDPEEPKYKIKYNGEEMELAVSDLTTYAQKGMNYDHVHQDLEKTRQTSAETQTALDRLTSVLGKLGYSGTPQDIADLIEAQQREVDPDQVRREREASEAQERIKQEAEAARFEAATMRREAVFARDLAEIQRLNPNIKTLNDLGDSFFKLRAAGLSNVEAYEIASKPKAGAKHDVSGKDHIKPTGGGSSAGGLIEIPKSEMSLWQESFPDDTPAKLKERYNRARKRQGE